MVGVLNCRINRHPQQISMPISGDFCTLYTTNARYCTSRRRERLPCCKEVAICSLVRWTDLPSYVALTDHPEVGAAGKNLSSGGYIVRNSPSSLDI